jgi:hypothetical protein
MRQVLRRPFAVLLLAAWAAACGLLYTGFPKADQVNDLLRYPRAERLTPAGLKLAALGHGYLVQHAAYQTTDDLARVHGWYARHLNPEQHEPPDAQSGCLALSRLSAYLHLRHALAVHLCPQPGGTLILVQRSLALSP